MRHVVPHQRRGRQLRRRRHPPLGTARRPQPRMAAVLVTVRLLIFGSPCAARVIMLCSVTPLPPPPLLVRLPLPLLLLVRLLPLRLLLLLLLLVLLRLVLVSGTAAGRAAPRRAAVRPGLAVGARRLRQQVCSWTELFKLRASDALCCHALWDQHVYSTSAWFQMFATFAVVTRVFSQTKQPAEATRTMTVPTRGASRPCLSSNA